MNYGLGGQIAIVTGGTMGIGEAVVGLLLDEGASIAVCARDEDRLAKLEKTNPDRIFTRKTDLNDSRDVEKFVLASKARFGRIDSLFYNAPNPINKPVSELSERELDESCHGIITSLTIACQLLIPSFQTSGGGNIVVISSLTAVEPMDRLAASSIFRAGIAAWVKLLAREQGKHGIRVNAILPGYTKTPLLELSAKAEAQRRGLKLDDVYREWGEISALGRLANASEIAYTALFLASAGASYITGTTLLIDGGAVRGI